MGSRPEAPPRRLCSDCGLTKNNPSECWHCWSPERSTRYWQRAYSIENEKANRAHAQIREALAILESGSDYERMHLRGILEAGL